jgi:replicative DNA helicase
MSANSGGSGGGNREQEISSISRSIKSIAKELDIPVIALSQLSRMVETRGGDKRPMLSDLRESGAIEQDADMVSFIYRPEYYKFTVTDDGEDTKGLAEFIISKHRHGALGTVKLKFIPRLAKFANYNTFSDTGFGTDSIAPNTSFSKDGNMIRGSKMNEDIKEDKGESPF